MGTEGVALPAEQRGGVRLRARAKETARRPACFLRCERELTRISAAGAWPLVLDRLERQELQARRRESARPGRARRPRCPARAWWACRRGRRKPRPMPSVQLVTEGRSQNHTVVRQIVNLETSVQNLEALAKDANNGQQSRNDERRGLAQAWDEANYCRNDAADDFNPEERSQRTACKHGNDIRALATREAPRSTNRMQRSTNRRHTKAPSIFAIFTMFSRSSCR